MTSSRTVHRLGLFAFLSLAFWCVGCQGPQGVNLGAHVGAGRAFDPETRGTQLEKGTGMEREMPSASRRTIDHGVYLYHEPGTGKSAPFKIGMSRSAADTLIRAQSIVMTRRSPSVSGEIVYVLGPDRAGELLIYLRFANETLVSIETPA